MTAGAYEANLDIARRFFAAQEKNDRPTVESLVDLDGPWWLLSSRTTRSISQYLDGFGRVYSQLVDGFRFNIVDSFGDDNTLGLRVEGWSQLPDGRIYDNSYFWMMRFRDGKIAQVWEYYDTALSSHFWSAPNSVERIRTVANEGAGEVDT